MNIQIFQLELLSLIIIFLIKHLTSVQIHIFQHFLIIKPKSQKFVCLKYIEFFFPARKFYHSLKWIWIFSVFIAEFQKSFKLIITRMIWCCLLTFLLLGILIRKQWVAFNLLVLSTLKEDCVIRKSEMLRFLPLKSNSLTIRLNLSSATISAHSIKHY